MNLAIYNLAEGAKALAKIESRFSELLKIMLHLTHNFLKFNKNRGNSVLSLGSNDASTLDQTICADNISGSSLANSKEAKTKTTIGSIATTLEIGANLDFQKRAVNSWVDAGFEVISVNGKNDIFELSKDFPKNVRFIESKKNFQDVSVAEIIIALSTSTFEIQGIFRNNTELLINNDFIELLNRNKEDIVTGSSISPTLAQSGIGFNLNIDNFDYVFFNSISLPIFNSISQLWSSPFAILSLLMKSLSINKKIVKIIPSITITREGKKYSTQEFIESGKAFDVFLNGETLESQLEKPVTYYYSLEKAASGITHRSSEKIVYHKSLPNDKHFMFQIYDPTVILNRPLQYEVELLINELCLLSPQNRDAWVIKAEIAKTYKDYQSALVYIQKAIDLEETSEIYNFLFEICFLSNDKTTAEKARRRIQQMHTEWIEKNLIKSRYF